jgi:hypothetical protein
LEFSGEKMRKGDLVKLDVNKCFTARKGGARRYPLGNHYEDEKGIVRAGRPTTPAERDTWRKELQEAITAAPPEERFGMACDSAGESRLAPRCMSITIHRDEIMVVERARCRVALGWNVSAGMTKVMLANGEEAYLKRGLLEVV